MGEGGQGRRGPARAGEGEGEGGGRHGLPRSGVGSRGRLWVRRRREREWRREPKGERIKYRLNSRK